MLDDESLYRAVLNGSESALTELIARYHVPLYRFLARQTGDAHLADDLVQETFTRLLTYRGTFPRRFKPWVYTIAANLARDHFKSAAYRYEHATDFGETESHADELGLPADDRQAVIGALAQLTPEHREVLVLRFYQALKLDEIAEVTNLPLGTVKSRLFHALREMKHFLAEVSRDRA